MQTSSFEDLKAAAQRLSRMRALNGCIDFHRSTTHSIGIRQALKPSDRPYPLDQLRWLPLAVGAKKSGVVGVYFLWEGPRLVYVGQSGNVGKRIYDHKNRKYTVATVMRVDRFDLRRQEAMYITRYRPIGNIEVP